jgi:hypothetical protein
LVSAFARVVPRQPHLELHQIFWRHFCGTMLVGLPYMTVTFWKNLKIVTLFEWDENILEQQEPIHSSRVSLPGWQDMAPR